ncbi:MAG: M48 family metalloprotease [Planctomycetota bacterium]
MNNQRMPYRPALLAGALLVSLVAPGCVTSPATGERQLVLISRQQEIAMGREAAPELEKELGGRVADEDVQAYVAKVGERVAAKSERPMPYEFHVVDASVPNALALPGGKIYITAGLLRAMESECELAAVLSHEVGHVADRHNVHGLQRQLGVELVAELAASAVGADAAQAARIGTQIAGGMVNLKYSREDEYLADRLGVRYMARAGYNPYGMVALLETLQREAGGGERAAWAEMFRTHPLTSNRIQAARDLVRRRYRDASPEGCDVPDEAFLRMQERLPAPADQATQPAPESETP